MENLLIMLTYPKPLCGARHKPHHLDYFVRSDLFRTSPSEPIPTSPPLHRICRTHQIHCLSSLSKPHRPRHIGPPAQPNFCIGRVQLHTRTCWHLTSVYCSGAQWMTDRSCLTREHVQHPDHPIFYLGMKPVSLFLATCKTLQGSVSDS